MMNPRCFIGLMSGTSCDGVDAALVEIAGSGLAMEVTYLASVRRSYPDELSEQLMAAMAPASVRIEDLTRLNVAVGEEFATCALALVEAAGVDPSRVAAIGSHGQTICHLPPRASGASGATLQIGDASTIAVRSGIAVVSDFRSTDVALGGQGAPLVPWTDHVLFGGGPTERIVQNLGGVANGTWLPAGGGPDDVLAFDTGPGCMVIDEIVRRVSDGARSYDVDGAEAARGEAVGAIVDAVLEEHPYFDRPPPKSTGREEFGRGFAASFDRRMIDRGLGPDDRLATATLLTARSLAEAYRRWLPPVPDGERRSLILAGGGAQNPTLVKALAEECGPSYELVPIDRYGIPPQDKECVSFAMLAAANVDAVPANLPQVTSASRRAVLGHRTAAFTFAEVPPPARTAAPAAAPAAAPGRAEASRAESNEGPRDRGHLLTEKRNPRSEELDRLTVEEAFDVMNTEDATLAGAVAAAREPICRVVDAVVAAFGSGGRLLYVGAGTSGRLGVIDAAECPPTFLSPPEQVQGIIAGGPDAVFRSIEGAEDDRAAGAREIEDRDVGDRDVVVGITAGGTTPFVLSAVDEARRRGATTAIVLCVPEESPACDFLVRLVTGPEVVTGSTRLKAGTATKLALNMITTLSMVRTGKVLGNWMVDLNAEACEKLRDRALRIVTEVTGLARKEAAARLEAAGDVKTAILAVLRSMEPDAARELLSECGGRLGEALDRAPV